MIIFMINYLFEQSISSVVNKRLENSDKCPLKFLKCQRAQGNCNRPKPENQFTPKSNWEKLQIPKS